MWGNKTVLMFKSSSSCNKVLLFICISVSFRLKALSFPNKSNDKTNFSLYKSLQ